MSGQPAPDQAADPQFGAMGMERRGPNPWKRIGCGLLLVPWFALLLLPCALFYLAAEGEIRFEHADIPQPQAHPRLLISLISQREDRGLRIVSSAIAGGRESGALCVETVVRFLLWESAAGGQDAQYCDCYVRDAADDLWSFSETFSGACPGPERE